MLVFFFELFTWNGASKLSEVRMLEQWTSQNNLKQTTSHPMNLPGKFGSWAMKLARSPALRQIQRNPDDNDAPVTFFGKSQASLCRFREPSLGSFSSLKAASSFSRPAASARRSSLLTATPPFLVRLHYGPPPSQYAFHFNRLFVQPSTSIFRHPGRCPCSFSSRYLLRCPPHLLFEVLLSISPPASSSSHAIPLHRTYFSSSPFRLRQAFLT